MLGLRENEWFMVIDAIGGEEKNRGVELCGELGMVESKMKGVSGGAGESEISLKKI